VLISTFVPRGCAATHFVVSVPLCDAELSKSMMVHDTVQLMPATAETGTMVAEIITVLPRESCADALWSLTEGSAFSRWGS